MTGFTLGCCPLCESDQVQNETDSFKTFTALSEIKSNVIIFFSGAELVRLNSEVVKEMVRHGMV